jgi:hypothetical protein
MNEIILALIIGIPLALLIGNAIKKYDGGNDEPWDHDAFSGRWE